MTIFVQSDIYGYRYIHYVKYSALRVYSIFEKYLFSRHVLLLSYVSSIIKCNQIFMLKTFLGE